MTQRARKKLYFIIITALVLFFVFCFALPFLNNRFTCRVAEVAKTNITFKGIATGGTLLLGVTRGAYFGEHYSINTIAGQSAESVVERFAKKIGSSNEVVFIHFARPASEAIPDMASGNILKIPGNPGTWYLAGTETGLGIPQAPVFLSCTYSETLDKHQIRWRNPPNATENDIIYIKWRYQLFEDHIIPGTQGRREINGAKLVPAITTSYTIDNPPNVKEYFKYLKSVYMDIWIMVLRFDNQVDDILEKGIPVSDFFFQKDISDENVLPSNITSMRVINKGMTQEESERIPFTGKVAPNWIAWSTDEKTENDAFEQGIKNGLVPISNNISVNSYYQIINAPSGNNSHGVYRKFLGLIPGHTYRITACISTLDMYLIKTDWSFSLHAIASNSDDSDLTPEQMASLAALPDGRIGSEAAMIASFGPDKTISKVFMDINEPEIQKYLNGAVIDPDITLPSDANEITIWWRFNCDDPNGSVGFSRMRVSDITN